MWPGVGQMQPPTPLGPWGGPCPGRESGDRLSPCCQGTQRGGGSLRDQAGERADLVLFTYPLAALASLCTCLSGAEVTTGPALGPCPPGPRPHLPWLPPVSSPVHPTFLPRPQPPASLPHRARRAAGWLCVSIPAPSASWPSGPPASEESSGIHKASWSWAGCGGLPFPPPQQLSGLPGAGHWGLREA